MTNVGKAGQELVVSTKKEPAPLIEIGSALYFIRGMWVMLDRDLARFYGKEPKHLNEVRSNNADSFPSDFAFQVTEAELRQLCETIERSKIPTFNDFKYLPFATARVRN